VRASHQLGEYMKQILRTTAIAVGLAAASTALMANNVPSKGVNLGIGVGGGYSSSFNNSKSGFGYLFHLGYQFTPYVGAEIGAMGINVANNFNTAFNASVSGAAATYVAMDLYAPFAQNWQGFLKLGVGHAAYMNEGFNIFKNDYGEGAAFIAGAGVAYYMTQHVSLEGYVQSAIYKHTFTIYGLGISYHF